MCNWIRETAGQREGALDQPAHTGTPLLRPRVLGAVTAGVVAVAMAAALLLPASTPAESTQAASARAAPAEAPVPVQASDGTAVAVRDRFGTPVVEQTAAAVDDGVPSSADVARSSGAGHCHHDL